MRCLDRNCGMRLHLEIEGDKKGAKKYTNPTLINKCTLDFNEHSWVKKQKISRDIDDKRLGPDDWNRRSVQKIYFEKKMNAAGATKNIDLIKDFVKECPRSELKVSSRDITIIRQNLKRKILESHKAVDRLDNILSSSGTPLMVEKVIENK